MGVPDSERGQIVNKEYDAAARGLHVLQNCLQACVELFAALRAREQRAEVEAIDRFVAERRRRAPRRDLLRDPFDHGVLAHARRVEQDGVGGALREDAQSAADCWLEAGARDEFAAARLCGQIACVTREGLSLRERRFLLPALRASMLRAGPFEQQDAEAKRGRER